MCVWKNLKSIRNKKKNSVILLYCQICQCFMLMVFSYPMEFTPMHTHGVWCAVEGGEKTKLKGRPIIWFVNEKFLFVTDNTRKQGIRFVFFFCWYYKWKWRHVCHTMFHYCICIFFGRIDIVACAVEKFLSFIEFCCKIEWVEKKTIMFYLSLNKRPFDIWIDDFDCYFYHFILLREKKKMVKFRDFFQIFL